jgi:hypothetical protein
VSMKKEMEGILGREGTQPCIRTEDSKTRLVYNLFDGFTGKNVKLTIEEVAEAEAEEEEEEVEWTEAEKGEEEEEIEWSEGEEESGELEIFEGMDTKEETGGEKPEA